MGDWWGGVNRVLRSSHLSKKESKGQVVHVLPDWVKVNSRLCYVSRSNGQVHHVLVKKIEERHQMVLIVFERDRKSWKRVPFSEIPRVGDGALRPLWKQSVQPQTVSNRPTDYVELDDNDPAEEPPDDGGAEAEVTYGPVCGPDLPPGPTNPCENDGRARERSRSR
mmetsp:Transcript_124840/g.249293  ORF Transcript_124840/g.249293 Transcript_124840/m.249293 type:complete len:166 (+) Transcript_124840:84-581(+)